MEKEVLFNILWKDYIKQTPSAQKIHDLLNSYGEIVKNDHIALRTVNLPEVNIEKLARPFLKVGYEEKGDYYFEDKKLNAKHYEHKTDKHAPKVFISELILEEFSVELVEAVEYFIAQIPFGIKELDALLVSGRTWGTISYSVYQALRNESEYVAWLYVFGFCANHFTVNINELKKINSIEAMNAFLKENDFRLNVSGGEVKGSKGLMLEQSSILADKITVEFIEGKYLIPSCYYEFAMRHVDENGDLFQGFIVKSADKIFESTDLKLQSSL